MTKYYCTCIKTFYSVHGTFWIDKKYQYYTDKPTNIFYTNFYNNYYIINKSIDGRKEFTETMYYYSFKEYFEPFLTTF